MHLLKIIAVSALLLVISGGFSASSIAAASPDGHNLLAKDKGKNDDKKNQDEDGGDKDRGHGNDPDNVDGDNPGKSKEAVVDVGNYTVDVSCERAEDSDETTCTYTGAGPDDGKDIGFIQVPDSAVCTEVTSSTGEWHELEPHTNLAGYTSEEDSAEIELTMSGSVATTSETTTYWIKAGSETFPARGPAIDCSDDPAAGTEAEAPAVTSTTAPTTTGAVTVETSTCREVPADTSGYDWFGMCEPGGNTVMLTLSPVDPALGEGVTIESDAGGMATFGDLPPGEYDLDAVDASWCHAASDSVNDAGKVVVESGGTATVWIFMCDGTKGGV